MRLLVLAWLAGCVIPEKHLVTDVFGPPAQVAISIAGADDYPTLTDDLTELYFARSSDIYVAKRASRAMPWSEPVRVAELSTAAKESAPEIAPDGLTIYLASDAAGGMGGLDVWVAHRTSRTSPWGPPALATVLNSAADEKCATPSESSDILVLASDRDAGQGYDLYLTSKVGAGPWAMPSPLAAINSAAKDSGPMLSADRLSLYFYSDRGGTDDLFVAHRDQNDAAFADPVPIAELDTDAQEANPWVSADGRYIMFSRDNTLFEASR